MSPGPVNCVQTRQLLPRWQFSDILKLASQPCLWFLACELFRLNTPAVASLNLNSLLQMSQRQSLLVRDSLSLLPAESDRWQIQHTNSCLQVTYITGFGNMPGFIPIQAEATPENPPVQVVYVPASQQQVVYVPANGQSIDYVPAPVNPPPPPSLAGMYAPRKLRNTATVLTLHLLHLSNQHACASLCRTGLPYSLPMRNYPSSPTRTHAQEARLEAA